VLVERAPFLRLVAAAASLAVVGAPLRAQETGSVAGRVSAAAEDRPLEGALVSVVGTGDSLVTGKDGLFRFDALPVGRRVLRVELLGMRSRDVPVDVDARRPASLSLVLTVSVIPVADLLVSVQRTIPVNKLYDFYRRMAHGDGVFFTRQDIARRHPVSVPDLLRQVSGIDVGSGPVGRTTVTMGRRKGCEPEYYVDGARAPHLDLDDLPPSDVAGLEVYRGNSEVPIEFKAFDRCGAIIVWTRSPGAPGGS